MNSKLAAINTTAGANSPSSYPNNAFRFTEKRGKLDWKRFEEVDLDRVLRGTDIDRLEKLLQNATYAELDKADIKRVRDKNLIKLFKLG
jgi:hypothetical protein